MQITTIGLDIAKNVFQVHAIDDEEKIVVRKQLRRDQVLRFFEELPLELGPNPAPITEMTGSMFSVQKTSAQRKDWSRPLPQPLAIGGDLMTVHTLADVRDLVERHLPKAIAIGRTGRW